MKENLVLRKLPFFYFSADAKFAAVAFSDFIFTQYLSFDISSYHFMLASPILSTIETVGLKL